MDQAEIEALLKAKYASGEADTGLYDTGLQYVIMDVEDGEIIFHWYSSLLSLDAFAPKSGQAAPTEPAFVF